MEDETTSIIEQPEAKRQEIREMYPEVYFPRPTLEPAWYGRRPTHKVPETKVLIDQNNGNVMSIVSENYKVVRYEDLVVMVSDITKAITDYGQIVLTPRTIKEGQRFQIQLKFPEMKKAVRKLDMIVPKIEIISSLDLSTKLIGRFGAFRLICTNGMGVWEMMKRFARRHLQSLDLAMLGETLKDGLSVYDDQVVEWKHWAETVVTPLAYDTAWQSLSFSSAEKVKIEVLPEISKNLTLKAAMESEKLTVWDFNAALTQFTTHNLRSDIRKIDLEPEIARVMEGTYRTLTT